MLVAPLQNPATLADTKHPRPSSALPQREGEAPAEPSPRGGFADRLSAAQLERRAAQASHVQKPDRAREAASAVVSQLFLLPMLEEMRKFPFGERFGSGGRTEKIFGERLDQYIADAVANSDAGMTEMVAAQLRRLERSHHSEAAAIVSDPSRDRKGTDQSGRPDRNSAVASGLRPGRSRNDLAGKS